jgi:hypothetical protein
MIPKGRARIGVFALGLLVLAGCVATTKTGNVFRTVQPLASGMAALYIYAPPTGMPVLGQMSTKVFIDSTAVVRIDETYFTRIDLIPGTYHIHAASDSAAACDGQLFPGTRYPPVVLIALPDQVYFIRYSSQPTVRPASGCERHLSFIESNTARDELRGLREVNNTFR